MRTLTTGAAALLIAAIVGMLALAGVQAQEPAQAEGPSYSTPDDLRDAVNAFITAVDLADVDGTPTDDKTDGRIVINDNDVPDTLANALAWVRWQEERKAGGKATLPAYQGVQRLKTAYEETKASCEAALGGTCEWATLAPVELGPVTVQVWVQRESLDTYTVRVLESTSRGPAVGMPQLATLVRDGKWRVQTDTVHTLGNGTKVAVSLRLLRDGRAEFCVASDRNGNGRYGVSDGGACPEMRYAPANTPFARPMLSSPVSIAYTPTTWWMAADGS